MTSSAIEVRRVWSALLFNTFVVKWCHLYLATQQGVHRLFNYSFKIILLSWLRWIKTQPVFLLKEHEKEAPQWLWCQAGQLDTEKNYVCCAGETQPENTDMPEVLGLRFCWTVLKLYCVITVMLKCNKCQIYPYLFQMTSEFNNSLQNNSRKIHDKAEREFDQHHVGTESKTGLFPPSLLWTKWKHIFSVWGNE